MRRSLALLLTPIFFLINGCIRESYLQSGLHGSNHNYKVMPMRSDSLKAATYFGGSLLQGLANVSPHDAFVGGQFSLHRAHNFKGFQAFYAANATIGNYHFNNKARLDAEPTALYSGGDRFYGGAGISAGINGVLASQNSEWRYLGFEISWQQEFGDYYQFRKNLPDAAVTYIDRHNHFITWGFNTELLGRIGRKLTGGYKAGLYASINELYRTSNSLSAYRPFWFSQTFHLGHQRNTYHIQMNTGTKLFGFNIGASFRVGR